MPSLGAVDGAQRGSASPGSVGRTAAWLSKQVELALAEVGLTLPQFRILGLLGEGTSLPSALAQQLAVRRPTVTAVVDGLAARGLVVRAGAPEDRRLVTHTLTPEGRRALSAADIAVDTRLGAIAAALGDATRSAEALDGLVLWRDALRAYHAARAGSGREPVPRAAVPGGAGSGGPGREPVGGA